MYSLGIIIFEMFSKIYCSMKDDRDRLINITNLKKNSIFPPNFDIESSEGSNPNDVKGIKSSL